VTISANGAEQAATIEQKMAMKEILIDAINSADLFL
jgi:hypothetical protein